jgi:hypothetical protein
MSLAQPRWVYIEDTGEYSSRGGEFDQQASALFCLTGASCHARCSDRSSLSEESEMPAIVKQ